MMLTKEEFETIWKNVVYYANIQAFDQVSTFIKIMNTYKNVFQTTEDGSNAIYFENNCSNFDFTTHLLIRVEYKNEDALKRLIEKLTYNEIKELVDNDLVNIQFIIQIENDSYWLEFDVGKGEIVRWD